MIQLGHGYYVQLRVYSAWVKYVITLIRFKYIHSVFHTESGTYFCEEKCHQMCYFIRMFNDKSKMIFVLG